MTGPLLSIVIPCFNERDVIAETAKRLGDLLSGLIAGAKISPNSQIVFVDDGSRDETWSIIEQLSNSSARIAGLKLSRNRGHQNALVAGLLSARGDIIISMDADLQDDLDVVDQMIAAWRGGAEIVFGVRSNRDSDSWFKKTTAEGYYRILKSMGVDIVHNHADYRLMSRRALEALREYNEVNLFLRGIIPLLGYKTAIIAYSRAERYAGESKYPFSKMVSLAFEGLTSFSTRPLRWISFTGAAVAFLSFTAVGWAIIAWIVGLSIPGWASTVIPMYFLGGIQLLSLGIIGEYLAKTYKETKARPRFHIEQTVNMAIGGFNGDVIIAADRDQSYRPSTAA